MKRDSRRQKTAKSVLGVRGYRKSAHHENHEQQDYHSAAHKPEFLAQNRVNKVVLREGEVEVFLG